MEQPAHPNGKPVLPENPAELVQCGRLELVARELVEGLMMGRHRSPFKGSSVEFVEHREYYPGDEIRHIDWRAYGKTGRYYVREFEDETNLRACLLVDASTSMAYAGQTVSKLAWSRVLAASLAWLLLTQRDSVGLVTFDSGIREQLKSSSHRDTYHRITRILEATVPGGETGIGQMIQAVLPDLPRRSLLILISDCLDSFAELRQALQRCRYARHEIVLFRIAAPEEEEFPFERPTRFHSLEHPAQQLLVDPLRLRREYLRQYREFMQQLARECSVLGIEYRRFLTCDSLQASLGGWLSERMLRHRGGP